MYCLVQCLFILSILYFLCGSFCNNCEQYILCFKEVADKVPALREAFAKKYAGNKRESK